MEMAGNVFGTSTAHPEGERLWTLGIALVTIIVPGEAVGDSFALMDFAVGRHISPPVHTHPQDETFFMLEGTITMQLAEQRFQVEPGDTVFIRAGVKHTWRSDTDLTRFLVLSTPAGIERLFRDLSVPATSRTLPPPDAPTLSPEEAERIFALHRHDNYGPPLGPDD